MLILPLTVFSQGSIPDSLQTHPVPKWQLWRMIRDVRLYRSCDTLQRFQADQIEKGIRVRRAADSLLNIRAAEIRAAEALAGSWQGRYENQVRITTGERRKTTRWRLIGGVSAAALVVRLVLGR